jgi:hypothetical protein
VLCPRTALLLALRRTNDGLNLVRIDNASDIRVGDLRRREAKIRVIR